MTARMIEGVHFSSDRENQWSSRWRQHPVRERESLGWTKPVLVLGADNSWMLCYCTIVVG
jgi:hypothetical protein